MQNDDFSNMKLVLIDDDSMVLRSVQRVLKNLGFSVSTFQDPLKGLAWIKDNGADIVISDICMPSCDGFAVLKQVKEIDPYCDLIFITAHGQMETAVRALREGATDFFEKPFTSADLSAAIERTKRFRILAEQKKVLADQLSLVSDELLFRTSDKTVMIGQSESMKKAAQDAIEVAQSSASVLIIGESGTGKELIANAIHRASPRSKQPMLTLNCASIPEDLFESEMFGHRRGAFTGAVETRGGYVESAAGGTLFLDEIGDLPMTSQAKILRLLEQKTYLPIGENKERPADVRIITATNQSLENLVKDKRFREDLYYRLNVCTIRLPALRDRKEDIPLLALYFTLHFAYEMGKAIDGIDDDALAALMEPSYRGNVRELRNIVENSVIHCKHGGMLLKSDLPDSLAARVARSEDGAQQGPWPMDVIKLEEVEKRLYKEALSRTNNNVSSAARLLGLSRGKLRRRLSALNIQPDNNG